MELKFKSMSHLKDFFFFFRPFLHLTKDSKYPTDDVLDQDKELLKFYLKPVTPLLKDITKRQLKRFFRYQWKRLIGWMLVSGIIVFLSYYAVKWYVEPKIVEKKTSSVEIVYIRTLRPFDQFVDAVVQKESSGDWGIVSRDGMLGAFQFHPSTLRKCAGVNVDANDFLCNKELQIGAFKQLLLYSHRSYKKYIDRWDGREIKNIKGTITESGILMGFHLRPESAIAFFESGGTNLGKPDGNGVYVSDYIRRFSGYKLPF